MTSSEQIENIERVVRLRSRRAAVGTGAADGRSGEDAVRSSVGAQATLDLAATTTAMMVMMTLDTTELLNCGLLEIRKSLLSRGQITRLKGLP